MRLRLTSVVFRPMISLAFLKTGGRSGRLFPDSECNKEPLQVSRACVFLDPGREASAARWQARKPVPENVEMRCHGDFPFVEESDNSGCEYDCRWPKGHRFQHFAVYSQVRRVAEPAVGTHHFQNALVEEAPHRDFPSSDRRM